MVLDLGLQLQTQQILSLVMCPFVWCLYSCYVMLEEREYL